MSTKALTLENHIKRNIDITMKYTDKCFPILVHIFAVLTFVSQIKVSATYCLLSGLGISGHILLIISACLEVVRPLGLVFL